MKTHPSLPPVEVVWFRVPDSTPFIQGFSYFRSRNWLDDYWKPNHGFGEQRPWNPACCQMLGPWYDGRAPANYTGAGNCLDPRIWEDGASEDDPVLDVLENGMATCCQQICGE